MKIVCFLTSSREDHPGREARTPAQGCSARQKAETAVCFRWQQSSTSTLELQEGFMNTRQKGKPRDFPHRTGRIASINRWL